TGQRHKDPRQQREHRHEAPRQPEVVQRLQGLRLPLRVLHQLVGRRLVDLHAPCLLWFGFVTVPLHPVTALEGAHPCPIPRPGPLSSCGTRSSPSTAPTSPSPRSSST